MSILLGLKKFESCEPLMDRIGVLIMEWERNYPNIDVRSQIQWAHTWLLENPRKDKKDYIRFLGNWMRSTERMRLEHRTNVVVHKTYKEEKPNEEDVMTGDDFKKMREALKK